MDIGDLESKKLSELRDIGRDMKIPGYTTMKKQDLVFRIMQADAESGGFHFRGGVLEVVEDDQDGTYRAVYTVKFAKAVFVLHCFSKKSKRGIETPKEDMDIIRARLKVAEALAKEL